MTILVLGSGGREHVLSWKLAQSHRLNKLYIAPGNAGTESLGENVALNPGNFEEVARFVREKQVRMIVVGPEAPLVDGIADYFREQKDLDGLAIIGPEKQAARLEGSKAYAKEFMKKYRIPTATYGTFSSADRQRAVEFLKTMKPPYVLKADGLAAGKGVLITHELEKAIHDLEEMFAGKFGAAGNTLVIEEYLSGIELSVFVLTDGKDYVLLPEAKDYKRIGEGDTGLNTGGMGSVSPVPFAGKDFLGKVEERIIKPTLKGLQDEGITYKGFIFFGLMNVNGNPFVVEYNARMGDPEAQVVIPRLDADLLDLFTAINEGSLGSQEVTFHDETRACIILASGGYPGSYEKNKQISGLDHKLRGLVFHAGTKRTDAGIVTNGGRVLAVSCSGSRREEALKKCLVDAGMIDFDKKYYRKDIGFDL